MDRDRTDARVQDIAARFDVDAGLVVLLGGDGHATRTPQERRADGRRLLVEAAARLVGVDPTAVSVTAHCARCGGDHGRPVVSVGGRTDLLSGSVSHDAGATVAAVAARAVGIDAESIAGSHERFAAIRAVAGPWVADAADGADVLRAWTTIEAVLKADGRGLEIDPSRVLLTGRPGERGTTTATIDDGPLYAVSSAVVDGRVVTLALVDATG